MDAIERITQRILQDAQQQADQIRQRGQKDAKDITDRYAALAKQERERIVGRGRQDAAERRERLGSAAAMEQRKLELAAKQRLLDEAFDLALEKLRALPEQESVALLAGLAARAARTGTEQLFFSPEDRGRIGAQVVLAANEQLRRTRPQLSARLTLSDETRPIPGGLILSDGEVDVNCAFDTLVRLQRESLEKDVARVLFAEGGK